MRLRRKITVAFFLVSSLVSLLLAVFLYRFIEKQLRSELRTRLRDIALIGSHSIDTHDLAALQAQTTEADLPKEQVTAVENSAAYRHLFDQLNQIRDTEPDLITYVYVLQPT